MKCSAKRWSAGLSRAGWSFMRCLRKGPARKGRLGRGEWRGSLCAAVAVQPMRDGGTQVVDGPRGVQREHAGFASRRFQRGELVGDQRGREEMARPVADARERFVVVEFQEREAQPGRGGAQVVAVAAAQRRAGQHDAPMPDSIGGVHGVRQKMGEPVQPAGPVLVGERLARAHLGDALGRMVGIAFVQGPAQQRSGRGRDAGFAAA